MFQDWVQATFRQKSYLKNDAKIFEIGQAAEKYLGSIVKVLCEKKIK